MKKSTIVSLLIFIVLLFDQVLKVWVKLSFKLYEQYQLFGLDWATLHFTENPGMAFGIEIWGDYGKLILSVFRIVMVFVMMWGIRYLLKKKAHFGLVCSVGLILAGALGNIIDSVLYGVIFSASSYHSVATFMPEAGGYSSVLYGKVVDMLHFPLFTTNFPQWFPFWGGQEFTFFSPVFNIADSAITIGVFMILIFQKRFFEEEQEEEVVETVQEQASKREINMFEGSGMNIRKQPEIEEEQVEIEEEIDEMLDLSEESVDEVKEFVLESKEETEEPPSLKAILTDMESIDKLSEEEEEDDNVDNI